MLDEYIALRQFRRSNATRVPHSTVRGEAAPDADAPQPQFAAMRRACAAVSGRLSRRILGYGLPVVLLAILAALPLVGAARAQESAVSIYQATLMETGQTTAEVSTAELREILGGGGAYVFDSRPHLEYAISHIPGALNVAPRPGVPMSAYVSDVAEIGRIVPDRTAAIVLYCNGPLCGKSKRLAEELLDAGYTNVRRYQLGAPTWRALVGTMQIEADGVRYVREGDRTAVWFDARATQEFSSGSLPGARNLLKADVGKAKDDGRLPMEDHNTRIVVFGANAAQAREVADEIARNAFHNVSFYGGSYDELRSLVP